ncbi:MAG TPA: NAD(P)-dependent oxidoreductase [Flavisolibacter sp.]|nr:NAD(P)-dependent oxidoreductase [Flavisolibacter sp.]
MKIALIGASGFVGTAILKEALERGHDVTAIVRNPERITMNHPNLIIREGDVFDPKHITELVNDQDVVISAYNPGWTNPNIYNEFVEGAKSVQAAVKNSNVKRLIVVGGSGSLFVKEGVQLIDTPHFPAEWKAGALGARDYLNILKDEKDLEWTFLSPAIEMHHGTSGERRGAYRTGLENPVFNEEGRSVISVEDTAVAVIDEAEHPQHIRKRFTVAY